MLPGGPPKSVVPSNMGPESSQGGGGFLCQVVFGRMAGGEMERWLIKCQRGMVSLGVCGFSVGFQWDFDALHQG